MVILHFMILEIDFILHAVCGLISERLCPGLAGEALTEALGDIRGDWRGVNLSNAS